MDLHSGQCYWPLQSGRLHAYPQLTSDTDCDVVIIGAGITGALLADQFVKEGVDVVVLERRDIGSGSTSASTAMLQYEIDTHLTELIKTKGRDQAERAYWLCCDAIDEVETLCRSLPVDCGFNRRGSFYFASDDDDIPAMEQEFAARKAAGFNIERWDSHEIAKRFNIDAKLGLYSHHGAEVDPYLLAQLLLQRAYQGGAQIFTHTTASAIEHTASGVAVTSEKGHCVHAKKVVFANGYEAQDYLQQKVVDLKTTYALITEPLAHFNGWHERCLVWESSRPYVYLRTTAEGRAIIGGEDSDTPSAEHRDAVFAQKCQRLEHKFGELMPDIPMQTAHRWAGVFGETKDGLAYIGETDEYPNGYFALGYGGNGILYSVVAVKILTDLYFGRPNPDADLFSFTRHLK